MLARARILPLLTCVCLLGGCANRSDAIKAPSAFEKRLAESDDAKTVARHEQTKKKYEEKLKDYNHTENLNRLWREGYGYDNPNPQRVKKGEKAVDFITEKERTTRPKKPKDLSDTPLIIPDHLTFD